MVEVLPKQGMVFGTQYPIAWYSGPVRKPANDELSKRRSIYLANVYVIAYAYSFTYKAARYLHK